MDTSSLVRYWEQESTVGHWDRDVVALDLERRLAWLDVLRRNLGASRRRRLRVLDVATGTGLFALLAAELRHAVIGVDRSNAMLRRAQQNARRLERRCAFVQGDAAALQLGEGVFDAVIGRYALSSMQEPLRALREWRRVLKPGGLLFLVEDDPDAGERKPVRRLTPWRHGVSPAYGKLYHELLQQSGADETPLELNTLLLRAGYSPQAGGHLGGQLQQTARWLRFTYHYPYLFVLAQKPEAT